MVWQLKSREARKETCFQIDPAIEELIPGFLLNRKKDAAQIKQASKREDFRAIETLGHWMKGAGSGYGFEEISVIGKDLEEAAKERNSETVKGLAAALERYLKSVHWKPSARSGNDCENSAKNSQNSF